MPSVKEQPAASRQKFEIGASAEFMVQSTCAKDDGRLKNAKCGSKING